MAERGLAGAVGAHEHVGLARANAEVDVVKDGLGLGSCREPRHIEQLFGHDAPFHKAASRPRESGI